MDGIPLERHGSQRSEEGAWNFRSRILLWRDEAFHVQDVERGEEGREGEERRARLIFFWMLPDTARFLLSSYRVCVTPLFLLLTSRGNKQTRCETKHDASFFSSSDLDFRLQTPSRFSIKRSPRLIFHFSALNNRIERELATKEKEKGTPPPRSRYHHFSLSLLSFLLIDYTPLAVSSNKPPLRSKHL